MPSHIAGQIPAYTPTMLSTYERCPLRYRRQYRDRDLPTDPFNPLLARGNATHRVLEAAYRLYQLRRAFPVDLRVRVEAHLSRELYDDDAARADDIEQVLEWITWDLMTFDGDARILAVERSLEYSFPGNDTCGPWRLRHTLDLVLEHPDGSIEHLDRKTGSSLRIDHVQRVAARIVVGKAFPGRTSYTSSTVFLAHQTTRRNDLSYEQVKTEWERMKSLVVALASDAGWAPAENPLCPWCPLYQAGCPHFPALDPSSDITDWLEGAA